MPGTVFFALKEDKNVCEVIGRGVADCQDVFADIKNADFEDETCLFVCQTLEIERRVPTYAGIERRDICGGGASETKRAIVPGSKRWKEL